MGCLTLFTPTLFCQNKLLDSLEEVSSPKKEVIEEAIATEEDTASEYVENDSSTENEYDEDAEPDTLYQRTIGEKKWDQVKKDKAFIYKHEIEKPQPEEKPKSNALGKFLSSGFFSLLLYGFVAFFIGFIVYHIFKNSNFNYFKSKPKSDKFSTEEWDDVTHFSDWEESLKTALSKEDYRLATRILYRQTLQKLNTANWIEYKLDKTNWEYVQKLKDTKLGDSFKELTRYFDYIWYGQFEIEKESFLTIQNLFIKFQNEI